MQVVEIKTLEPTFTAGSLHSLLSMHEAPPRISQALQLVGTWSLVCAEYREIPHEGEMPAVGAEVPPEGEAASAMEILHDRAAPPIAAAEIPSELGAPEPAAAAEGPAGGGGGVPASGSVVSYLGASPRGSLVYTAEGFMSVQVCGRGVWGRFEGGAGAGPGRVCNWAVEIDSIPCSIHFHWQNGIH